MSEATEAQHAPIRGRATVLANEADGSGRRLRLAVPAWPGSIPGQFLMIGPGALSDVPRSDPLLPRPMAVYRDATESATPEVEVLYQIVGRGTTLLSEMTAGQSVGLVGPLGRGFPVEAGNALAILVGGGTGIASLYSLARALVDLGRPVVVILGARDKSGLLARDDFAGLDAELICTTEDGSEGHRGLVTEPLAERLAADPTASVFAVGPTPMMKACAELAAQRGAKCFVSLENPMACGFGVCLGCAAPRSEGGFSLVCRAGPVFEATEIDWEGLP